MDSDSVQKMLSTLFKLIWNTQKSTCTHFFKYQGKVVVNNETVLVKINEEQP